MHGDAGGVRGHKGRKDKVKIEHVYEFHEDLGKGAFGVVKKAKNLETGIFYAVKIIDKTRCGAAGMSEIFSEVEIVSLLSHRYIIALKEVYDTRDTLYLVMELLQGGELESRLKKVGPFSESTCKRYTRNILLAIEYIHRLGIVHRDLKPANMLLAFDSDASEVKIVDFGFAVLIGNDACLQSCTGTPAFMAPEILGGEPYGQAVDMWAVGVIVYHLLSGGYPFPGHSSEQIQELIRNGFKLPDTGVWTSISAPCKDMIRKLLTLDPDKRLTAIDALYHPWVRNGADEDFDLFPSYEPECVSGVNQKRRTRRLRLAGKAVICCNRLIYLQRSQALKKIGVENPVILRFAHLIHRTLECREVDCSTFPIGNKGSIFPCVSTTPHPYSFPPLCLWSDLLRLLTCPSLPRVSHGRPPTAL